MICLNSSKLSFLVGRRNQYRPESDEGNDQTNIIWDVFSGGGNREGNKNTKYVTQIISVQIIP